MTPCFWCKSYTSRPLGTDAGSLLFFTLMCLCNLAACTQRRGQYTLSTPWNQVSGDPISWTEPGQPRLWAAQEAEGMANVHVTVWLMVTASPYLQACKLQEQQEMAKGIYIATLCLSKGAVLHRLLWTFSLGEDMACAVSAGPPDVLVKLITPPEKEEGYYAFLVSSFSRWPDQGTFFSKGFPDPFSQGSERMGNSNGKM